MTMIVVIRAYNPYTNNTSNTYNHDSNNNTNDDHLLNHISKQE